jgi:hypothetical protein
MLGRGFQEGSQYGTTPINEDLLGLQKREYLAKTLSDNMETGGADTVSKP